MSAPFSRRHFLLAVAAVVAATALLLATLSRGASATPRDAAEVVTPALVNINTNLAYQGAQAAGTGIVLTSDGTVLTNNHVIRGATTIRATDVGNGRTYSATVVGYDVGADLAVLKLKNASGLTTAKIGDSSKVRVGDAVVAVGNAGGAGGIPSSSRGSIVRLGSSITASDGGSNSERLTGMLETDAQLQPGDSGGALADVNGHVIGINTAAGGSTFRPSYGLWGDDSGSSFSGFAIPINRALDKVKQIQKGQASATTHIGPTALLGVSVGSSGYGYGYGYSDTATGALVQNVLSGSGAERAGLQPGDVITAVDGRRITASTTLTNVLLRHSPSQSVTVVWTDQYGSSHRASVRLMVGPPQ